MAKTEPKPQSDRRAAAHDLTTAISILSRAFQRLGLRLPAIEIRREADRDVLIGAIKQVYPLVAKECENLPETIALRYAGANFKIRPARVGPVADKAHFFYQSHRGADLPDDATIAVPVSFLREVIALGRSEKEDEPGL